MRNWIAVARMPLFWVGFAARLACLAFGSESVARDWYLPFLRHSSAAFTLDPWTSWVVQQHDPAAFPYGPSMLLFFAPVLLVGSAWPDLIAPGYFFTLFAADLALLAVLATFTQSRLRNLMLVYWLSPIIVVATYVYGYNDVIPIAMLFVGLLLLKNDRYAFSGITVALAISIKLSMLLALPFIVIYFLRNRSVRGGLSRFLTTFAASTAILWVPLLMSPGAIEMIFTNREASKVFRLDLASGSQISIFLVPLVYILFLYAAISARRMNVALLQVILGLSFLAVVLLSPAPPGWFIWVVPLLSIYGLEGDNKARILTFVFSALFVVYAVFYESWPDAAISWLSHLNGSVPDAHGDMGASVAKTAIAATGLVLGLRIWRDAIQRNDWLRLSNRPFGIAIAGDSGSGKDAVAASLIGAFGEHSVAHVSGDDYHVWDREQPMWRALTHLNPRANDLDRFASDVTDLMNGRKVWVRRYDHQTGKRSQPVLLENRDYVIVTGLHALYTEQMRSLFGVSVYLEMDEALRQHLKVQRDTSQRGRSREEVLESIQRRRSDAEKYVNPQREFADLVISLRPRESMLMETTGELSTYLDVYARAGYDERKLARVLIGLCGLHVDFSHSESLGGTRVVIDGDISKEDVALAARLGCPKMMEFLDREPQWLSGSRGLIMLLVLMTAEQAMTRRLLA